MPRADSPSGSDKEEPLQVNSETDDELDQYDDEQEEINGNGPTDRLANNTSDDISAQDDPTGGGKSRKIEDVNPDKTGLGN